jgi:type IV pilus assembly protein PilY1
LNNVLNSPLAVDFDKDRRADRIYVGDLYGNLYRVAGIGKGQSPAAAKLFAFDPAPATPDRNPIRGKASYAHSDNAGEIWVYYGTGRHETEADKAIQNQQYAFGLKDKLTSPPSYKLSDLFVSEAAFTADGKHRYVNPPGNQTNPQFKSWALKLKTASNAPSERILGKPLAVGGIVFFTSFVPGTDACASVGETWVFALDFKTGLAPEKPVFDINGDGKFNDLDKVQVGNNPNNKKVPIGLYIGPGQGSSPVLLRDTLFITTTAAQNQSGGQLSGGLHALLVNLPQLKVRMESWKHD